MVTRHHLVSIILAVLLAASLVAISYFYSRDKDAKEALQTCEKRLSEQNKKMVELSEIQMRQVKSTYEELISGLKEQIQNKEVTIKDFKDALSLNFVDRILFEFGKADLTPEGGRILEKVGEALKNIKGKKIRVTGHTDNVPIRRDFEYKFPSNWELSAARAASVVRYFQDTTGLDPADMEAIGRSFYQPVASQETDAGRAQNRRVEIFIAPQMEIREK